MKANSKIDVILDQIGDNVCLTIFNSNIIKDFLDNIKSSSESAFI